MIIEHDKILDKLWAMGQGMGAVNDRTGQIWARDEGPGVDNCVVLVISSSGWDHVCLRTDTNGNVFREVRHERWFDSNVNDAIRKRIL